MTLLMLDSGAFSVWSKGSKINIDEYIGFCRRHPDVSYYVNLDVLIGKKGDPRTKMPSNIEMSCRESWKNYLKMVRALPEDKVIPVFHRGEDFRWLERYLDFGCSYIGIGQTGHGGWDYQVDWLNEIKSRVLDSRGNLKVRTHGFAVTSLKLLRFMPWHSVDSATWVKIAAFGGIFVPRSVRGEYRFDIDPLTIQFSSKSPSIEIKDDHFDTLSLESKAYVRKYVEDYLGKPIGRFEELDVPSGYKLKAGEIWSDASKSKVMRTVERGVSTSYQDRFYANVRFFHRANEELPVDHIYFAGAEGSVEDDIEFMLGRRLMSYHYIQTACQNSTKRSMTCFRRYLDILKEERQCTRLPVG